MKRRLALVLLVSMIGAASADAARVRVTRTGPHRTRVTVRTVRTGPVVRVAPHVYLPAVHFRAVVVTTRPAGAWTAAESLDASDGWTDFNIDVDRRGTRLLLEVERGPARISHAEVVFDNGDAQVIDFDDRVQAQGVYSLLDFANGRKVDHVRVVASAAKRETTIRVHLVQ